MTAGSVAGFGVRSWRSSARAVARSGTSGVVFSRRLASALGGERYQSEREGSRVQLRYPAVAPLWHVGVVFAVCDLLQLCEPVSAELCRSA